MLLRALNSSCQMFYTHLIEEERLPQIANTSGNDMSYRALMRLRERRLYAGFGGSRDCIINTSVNFYRKFKIKQSSRIRSAQTLKEFIEILSITVA